MTYDKNDFYKVASKLGYSNSDINKFISSKSVNETWGDCIVHLRSLQGKELHKNILSRDHEISDNRYPKKDYRLIYCSICGQKQDKPNQKYCSNCGSPFYAGQEISHEDNILYTEQQDENPTSNLNSIGGWLIIPYIGFYIDALVSILYIFSYHPNL